MVHLISLVLLLSIHFSSGRIQTINVDTNDLNSGKLSLVFLTCDIFTYSIQYLNFIYCISNQLKENECPPLSQNLGRCGPSWGGRCNKNLVDYAVYCNEDNGWCGVSWDHKNATSSDIYDWEPQSCQRNKHLFLFCNIH